MFLPSRLRLEYFYHVEGGVGAVKEQGKIRKTLLLNDFLMFYRKVLDQNVLFGHSL